MFRCFYSRVAHSGRKQLELWHTQHTLPLGIAQNPSDESSERITQRRKKTEISLFCTDCCAASHWCWKNFVCSTLKIYISYKSNYTLLSFWVLLVFHHHLRLSFVLFSLINDSSCNFWMNAFELDSQNSAFQMCTCIALRCSNQLINSIELIWKCTKTNARIETINQLVRAIRAFRRGNTEEKNGRHNVCLLYCLLLLWTHTTAYSHTPTHSTALFPIMRQNYWNIQTGFVFSYRRCRTRYRLPNSRCGFYFGEWETGVVILCCVCSYIERTLKKIIEYGNNNGDLRSLLASETGCCASE